MSARSPMRRSLATGTCWLAASLFWIGLVVVLTGCGSLAPQNFGTATPVFDPLAFFTGPTHSWGVFENLSGNPTRRFATVCQGTREGSILVLDQTFTYDDGSTQQRHWRIRQVDSHRYEATANDVVGTATGAAYGNAFSWQYTVALQPGNPLLAVQLKQWMYLQTDGTVLNRASIQKLGVRLAQVTEYFQRGKCPPLLVRVGRGIDGPKHLTDAGSRTR